MAGFCGIAIIFLLAMVDAVRLLGNMRSESEILRNQALARTHQLASIRSSIFLTDVYLGDYLLYSGRQQSREYVSKIGETWARVRSGMSGYRSSTADEEVLLERVQALLDQNWQDINRRMNSPAGGI